MVLYTSLGVVGDRLIWCAGMKAICAQLVVGNDLRLHHFPNPPERFLRGGLIPAFHTLLLERQIIC